MTFNIYHQCGHNGIWNRNSYENDKCGNGLILSPVHMKREAIEKLPTELKNNSFFDPQFYLPNSQKTKFKTYDFFPEIISNGFVTSDFSNLALESAKRCIDFQITQEFKRLIIPARHFSEMVTGYTDKQDVYTVHPYLKAIDEIGYQQDVYLTLPITSAMLQDDEYRTTILNWLASYPRLDGVYLLVEDKRKTKQIQDSSYLKQYFTIVKELTDIGLQVTIGHANTEGLLFSMISNCEITFGAFENTRIFSTDKFVVSDEERRGPRPRIYLPGLLNWIQYSSAKEIKSEMPNLWDNIYYQSSYADDVLNSPLDPHFSQPNLYMHFFASFQNQVDQIKGCTTEERYKLLHKWLKAAEQRYEEIKDEPIDLDTHGRGDNIIPWLTAINWYNKTFMK